MTDSIDMADFVPDERLRGALEVAFVVAVIGARQRPPIPPPSALRPFLKLQKLPDRALSVVRRAVESDEAFRERAAAVANEETVDAVGRLWLQRPEGWESALAAAASEIDAAEAVEDAERHERSASRRLERAEEAGRRAKADLARERLEARAIEEALESERTRRVSAEADRDKALARLGELERALERLRRNVDEAEMSAAAARARVGEIEEEQARMRSAYAASTAIDRVRLAAALEQAGRAIADASALVDAPVDDAPQTAPSPTGRSRPPAPPRRAPLVLPGLFADSREAADWLVRQPNIWLLVDGYNVAKLAWPDASLEQQRGRLVDALVELKARLGTDTRVVFDGAGEVSPGVPRSGIVVTYSAAGVSADDAIVDLVGGAAIERHIVVATTDADVRRRAGALGANTIASAQFLTILGR